MSPARRAVGATVLLVLAAVIVLSLVQLTEGDPGDRSAATPPRSDATNSGLLLPSSVATRGTNQDVSPTPSATSGSSEPSGSAGSGTSIEARPARQVAGIAERPRSLVLPDGTKVPVLAVGTTADGHLQVPDDIRTAGWWEGGARIGDPFGAMLVAAHVDSTTQGLGPYAQLLSSAPGSTITVSSADLRQKYRLSERIVVSRDALPQQQSIFSAAGSPRLILVTCSGPYVKSEGGYQNLAILTATPTGSVQDLS